MFARTQCESFGQAFLKACEVEGAKPSSRSAEREIPQTALFFLLAFSFAPIWSKEKAAKGFFLSNSLSESIGFEKKDFSLYKENLYEFKGNKAGFL